MVKRLHIVVSDPSPIVRCGVVTLLQRSAQIGAEVVEVADLSDIHAGRYDAPIDLIIVNPSQMGLVSPSQLRTQMEAEGLKIVALQSAFFDPATLQNFDSSISIYDSAEDIIEKIAAVCKATTQEEDEQRCGLSQREREIIVCVVKGMTNKQIADTLFLSIHTVISHRRNIASKLQIHSPAGLTIYAIVNKLVDLAEIRGSINL
ncbi:MAG: LuxR C-terminal-related transcriptional regulator [Rikenellaceae bacterium]